MFIAVRDTPLVAFKAAGRKPLLGHEMREVPGLMHLGDSGLELSTCREGGSRLEDRSTLNREGQAVEGRARRVGFGDKREILVNARADFAEALVA